MKLTVLLKVLVRLVPLIALGIVLRPLTFRPAAGSTLTKVLEGEWSVHLDEMLIAINGSVWWTGYTMETELAQRIAITDTYLKVQGGRPMALDREFCSISQDLENSLGGGAGQHVWESVAWKSELEGAVVQFRREEDAYTKRFHPLDRYLDDGLLDGLTEDMDLRILLPKEPVTVGDEWDIDLASLPDLLSPGGYFAWTIESEGTTRMLSDALDPALMGELRHVLGSMLEGRATVEYVAEDDGHSQLDISIDIEGTKKVDDLLELVTEIVAESPGWGTIEFERFDLEFALKAAGTAQWDTQRGHISSLALEGKVQSAMDLEIIWDAGSDFLIGVRTAVSGDFVQRFDTR